MTGPIRERKRLDAPSFTAKEAATILQRRCVITTATRGQESDRSRLSERGEIRVGPIKKFGDHGYAFVINEESNFEFRGRKRREVIWSVTVYIDLDYENDNELDIGIYEEKNLESMPHEILQCAITALSPSDRNLL